MNITKQTFLIFFCIFFLFSFVFTESFAQTENEAKRETETTNNIKAQPNGTEAVGDKIEFKNSSTTSILTITDEGNNAGSIELKDLNGNTADNKKLENDAGNLLWGGNNLSSGGVSAINDLSDAKHDSSSLFLGVDAGLNNDGTNNQNTAVGSYALYFNTTGIQNTAYGHSALISNTTGSYNTAYGSYALNSNTTGYGNTAYGRTTLNFNTTGIQNTAYGHSALQNNTNGNGNIAIGYEAGKYYTGSDQLFIENSSSNTPLIGGNFSTDEIYLNGNVGIGTSSPLGKLHVKGASYPNSFVFIESDATEDAGIRLREGTTTKWHIFNDGAGQYLNIRNEAFSPVLLLNQSNGNIGIGNESANYKLHVVDNSSSEVVMINNTNTNVDSDGLIIKVGTTSPNSQTDFIFFKDGNGNTVGSIDGNDTGGGLSYNTTSDERLKTNIKEYNNALETINKIGIKQYERFSNPGSKEIGVLAQELQKVYPQAVSGSPDSNVKTDPMMVDYSKLTPLLVRGMQEQQETIEELKKVNKEFRNQNAELEKRLAKLESLLGGNKVTKVGN